MSIHGETVIVHRIVHTGDTDDLNTPAYVIAPASAVAASLEDSGTPVVDSDDDTADDAETASKAASKTKGK